MAHCSSHLTTNEEPSAARRDLHLPRLLQRAGGHPPPLRELRNDARGRLQRRPVRPAVARPARAPRELPPLAGNLRDMERELGISYPTVRSPGRAARPLAGLRPARRRRRDGRRRRRPGGQAAPRRASRSSSGSPAMRSAPRKPQRPSGRLGGIDDHHRHRARHRAPHRRGGQPHRPRGPAGRRGRRGRRRRRPVRGATAAACPTASRSSANRTASRSASRTRFGLDISDRPARVGVEARDRGPGRRP